MTFATMNWEITPHVEEPNVASWAQSLGVTPQLVQLCVNRGMQTQEDIEQFLTPHPTLWHDPYLMHDMDRAVERIGQAVETGEMILIYGDYDADGITSTTILYETLEMMGANVAYYLPNRFTDGYGPNQSVFEDYVGNGVTLIITVDCGIAAHGPIEWAMAQGCDVVLTDHHEIPAVIPKAYAVVHPRHPDGQYPFGDLSGAGVAFKVSHALLGEIPEELLEVAAIGTIADLVSLTNENRTIVKLGLQQLSQTGRIGLVTLFETLSISMDTVDEKTIGFQIAPRFNALGRLGDATPGVSLLTTFDEDEAKRIVTLMQEENTRRQQIVDTITTEALALAEKQADKHVLILAQTNWHPGVLGIVASRVVEQVKKPTIVLGISEDGLEAKGSGRSYGAFNLYEALQACSESLAKFGGHHSAAGLTVETVRLPSLLELMDAYAVEHHEQLTQNPQLHIDEMLPLSEVTVSLIDSFERLRPFGMDNPEPVFLFENVTLTQKQQLGAEQQHLKLTLGQNEQSLQAIAFQKGSWATQLNVNSHLDVVGTLEINEWQQNRLPQLMLQDILAKDPMIFDWRTNKIRTEQLQVKQATYIVERPNLKNLVAERIPQTSIVQTMQEWLDSPTQTETIVLFDCPMNRTLMDAFRQKAHGKKLYIIAFQPHPVMTTGIPTREKFKQVYHYFKTHPSIPYNEKTGDIATYLKIPLEQFKIILKVFFEVEFVIIKDGFLIFNEHPTAFDVMESSLMQQLKNQLWLEKVFIYSQFSDLTKWLTNP